MLDRDSLKPYQVRGVEFIKSNPKCALWLDMGLGKTVTTLTAFADLYEGFEANRCLIIAPKRVAMSTWPTEIRAWQHTKDLTFAVLAGKAAAKRRDLLLNDKSDIHLINRENVQWLVDLLLTERHPWPYDVVVIDEASSFKSHAAKRFKKLRLGTQFTPRVIELTGTPAGNGLIDLWPQVYLLDEGKRLGKNITAFRNRWFYRDFTGYNYAPRKNADTEIRKAVADICLTMRAEDYLSLPPLVENVVEVELPPGAAKKYKQLEKEFLVEIDEQELAAPFAAALTNKLTQFANGAVYDEDGDAIDVHSAKLDALDELVSEAAGQPVLVAYNFKHDATRIETRFPQAVRLGSDPDQIDAWNRGEIPLLLAHPASAGHGLNLQKGGSIAVWFGLNWSLELYQQFNARLHRQGQEKPVFLHHIVAKNTVDETIMAALRGKEVVQNKLLDALKADISKRN